jgi:hypothetical protein
MKRGYGKRPETGQGRGLKVAFDSARVERTLLSVAFDVDLRCHHENLDDKTWDTGVFDSYATEAHSFRFVFHGPSAVVVRLSYHANQGFHPGTGRSSRPSAPPARYPHRRLFGCECRERPHHPHAPLQAATSSKVCHRPGHRPPRPQCGTERSGINQQGSGRDTGKFPRLGSPGFLKMVCLR